MTSFDQDFARRFPRFQELNTRLLAYLLLVFGDRRVIGQRTPEDVQQEIWMRVLPRLSRGELSDPMAYLTTTARNVVANLLRDGGRRLEVRRERRAEILVRSAALPSEEAAGDDARLAEVDLRLDAKS